MTEFVAVMVGNGDDHLLVAVPSEAENQLVEAGRVRDFTAGAAQTLVEALDSIRGAAAAAVERARAVEPRPSEVTVEFGVQLGTEAGVVVASTTAAANMRLTFTWNQSDWNA